MEFPEINWLEEAFDTVASISGKYARWLNARRRRVCFIIGSICVVYWAGRDIYLGLYSQAIFCIFSVGLNVYGYINWGKKDKA